MTRALIVERDTTELRITLHRWCRPATVESVKLTITRAGLACRELRSLRGEQFPSVCPSIPVRDWPPSKVYSASQVEPGLAVFVLDRDLLEAPEGWYRAMIEADSFSVGFVHLLVLCSGIAVSPRRMACIGPSQAK